MCRSLVYRELPFFHSGGGSRVLGVAFEQPEVGFFLELGPLGFCAVRRMFSEEKSPSALRVSRGCLFSVSVEYSKVGCFCALLADGWQWLINDTLRSLHLVSSHSRQQIKVC